MNVNVFISTEGDGQGPVLLVVPDHPSVEIPRHLRSMGWRQLATTSHRDGLLGEDAAEIEVDLSDAGYAMIRRGSYIK